MKLKKCLSTPKDAPNVYLYNNRGHQSLVHHFNPWCQLPGGDKMTQNESKKSETPWKSGKVLRVAVF